MDRSNFKVGGASVREWSKDLVEVHLLPSFDFDLRRKLVNALSTVDLSWYVFFPITATSDVIMHLALAAGIEDKTNITLCKRHSFKNLTPYMSVK